jgi:hypothetical protein
MFFSWKRKRSSVEMQKYETARKLIFLDYVKSDSLSYLFEDAVSGQFHLIGRVGVQIMDRHRRDLHDVPYVEQI